MPRLSSPGFRLFSAQLTQVAELGLSKHVIDKILPDTGLKRPETGFSMVPTALRWTTDPVFGYPRQPFNLYRRPHKYRFEKLIQSRTVVNGELQFSSLQGDLYLVLATTVLTAGQQLRFDALNRDGVVIAGKTVTVTVSGPVEIRCPNMAALQVRGTGILTTLNGVVQGELVNEPDWELIQRVGLPLAKGELADPVYRTFPQGWTTAPDLPGDKFARFRLLIGQALHLPMPLLPDGTQPVWKAPDPTAFLHYLHTAPDSLLTLVKKCLESTDDTAADPARRQQAFLATITTQGLRQDGFPGIVQPAVVTIPVVQTGLLAASTDNYASLALGYGSYDFPPAGNQATGAFTQYDYMVTATYVVRPFESIFDFSVTMEFAALSEERPLPEVPANLQAVGQTPNRPLHRDAPTTEPVQLRFGLPSFPQSYGIIRSSAADKALILNNPKVYSPGSFDPFLPDIPINSNASFQCRFTDPFSPVPLVGTDPRTYFMAGLDLFGRWSVYATRGYSAQAISPEKPGLLSLALRPNAETVPGNSPPIIPCTAEVEFSWDWTERSPKRIELGGGFYPADDTTPPSFTDRFAQQSGNAPLPVVQITFNAAGVPASSVGEVHFLPNLDPAADPNIRRYRLIVSTIQPTFPGPLLTPVAGLSKVAYSVVARALEAVRAATTEFSPWVGPVVDELDDPRPPVMVSLPADVRWTALPDATRVARGKLNWPVVAGAAGYVVWQASETALREMLGQPHRPLDPYVDRATELRDLLLNATQESRSLTSFTRLNRDPLRTTSVEVDLPGSASTLFVYRVSALNGANLESNKSNALFVAVPRLNVPSQPTLKLVVVKNTDGSAAVDIIALNGGGLPPAGFRVYQVRKAILTNEVGLKGLPSIQPGDAGWQPVVLTGLDGSEQQGQSIRQIITERSWKPYYYQVVAVGVANLTEGLLAGESDGSPTGVTYIPPDTPPMLTVLSDTQNAQCRRLELSTSVPFGPLVTGTLTRYLEGTTVKTGRLGESRVEVMDYTPSSPVDLPRRVVARALNLPQVKAIATPPTLTVPPFDGSKGVEISRVDATNRLYIRVPITMTSGFVRVTDPLGRSTEILFTTP